jgi:hypothetical protein
MVSHRMVAHMISTDLPADLGSNPDYAWLVQRVSQDRLPWVLVPRAAVAHWTAQDPEGWAKVLRWLHEQRVALVQI